MNETTTPWSAHWAFISRRLDRAGERVAGVRVTRLIAGTEPVDPLFRRAVRPCLRVDLPGSPFLNSVVTDSGGRVERLVDLGLAERFGVEAGVHRVLSPHAGVAVGLELEANRSALRTLPVITHSIHRPEQILNMMAVLVRDDVGLRERTALGTKLRLELLEEPKVEVDLLIRRAIERSDL